MSKIVLVFKARPLWLLIVAASLALIVGLLIPTAPGFRGPIVDINDGILVAVITALGLFVTGLSLFVAQLWQRLGKIENDLKEYRKETEAQQGDLAAAASFINRIGLAWRQWIVTGRVPAEMPQPPAQLAKHGVDAELWEQDAPGGTD